MYKDFDIKKFNEEFNAGDLSGLEYIGKTIIDNLEEDIDRFTRTDYLKGLYRAVMGLNYSLSAYETGKGFITDKYLYDYYYNIRDLFFEELGLKNDTDSGEYYLSE
jgi:hypothetical protein